LEFIYCDKFVESTTTTEVRKVSELCKYLKLPQSFYFLKKRADFAKMKIEQGLLKDMTAQNS